MSPVSKNKNCKSHFDNFTSTKDASNVELCIHCIYCVFFRKKNRRRKSISPKEQQRFGNIITIIYSCLAKFSPWAQGVWFVSQEKAAKPWNETRSIDRCDEKETAQKMTTKDGAVKRATTQHFAGLYSFPPLPLSPSIGYCQTMTLAKEAVNRLNLGVIKALAC